MNRPRPHAALLAAAVAVGCAGCAGNRAAERPVSQEPEVNRRYEVAFPLEHPGRAADEVAVTAELSEPSGRVVRLRGFPDGNRFRVRFRPREPGRHRFRVLADVGPGRADAEVLAGAFEARDRGASGQVVRRTDAPRHLAYEDGRPFFVLGENRSDVVHPAGKLDRLSAPAHVARLARSGMNTLRVSVFTDCAQEAPRPRPQPGCLEPRLGRFDPEVARAYDAVFEAAERHGVQVVLVAFAAGFTLADSRKSFDDSPYAAARGGPARTPAQLFALGAAQEAAKRRLRYLLARWGYSTSLLAVDLLSEPGSDGAIAGSAWIPWAEEMARTWRAEDPYGHLISVGSVGLHRNVEHHERAWWASPLCDVVQWHRHGEGVHDPHDLAAELEETIRDTRQYGKPVLVGGFGDGGEDQTTYDHTHVGIWAATFAGAGVLAHGAPPFGDPDQPMTAERARHFAGLARFLGRLETWGPLDPAESPRAEPQGTRALALGAGRRRAVWVQAPRSGYGAAVERGSLTLGELTAGRWRAVFWDDLRAEPIGSEDRDAGRGGLSIELPPYARHLAVTVEPVETPGAPTR